MHRVLIHAHDAAQSVLISSKARGGCPVLVGVLVGVLVASGAVGASERENNMPLFLLRKFRISSFNCMFER
jgi:hypothetical protein